MILRSVTVACAVAALVPAFAYAQGAASYPSKPLRFVVGLVPGAFCLVAFFSTRSGSSRPPVSRFHSSYVSGVITASTGLPST